MRVVLFVLQFFNKSAIKLLGNFLLEAHVHNNKKKTLTYISFNNCIEFVVLQNVRSVSHYAPTYKEVSQKNIIWLKSAQTDRNWLKTFPFRAFFKLQLQIRLRENLKTNSESILIRYHPKLNLPVLLTLGFVLTTYLCSSFGRDRYNVTFKPINSKIHQILERLRSKVITLSSY